MGCRILVVDNEIDEVESIQRSLARRDFDVDGEPDPTKVASRIKKTFYDVVLLDIHMPSYGGVQVLMDIMAYSPASKVILISGIAKGEEILECIKRGAVDFVSKPIDMDGLEARIQIALRSPELGHDPKILREYLIESLWSNVKYESADKRGARLEQLMTQIFRSVSFFQKIKVNIRLPAEEIDIDFLNEGVGPFWASCGGLILAECKNWSEGSSSVSREDFDGFYSKLEMRGSICKMGFYISYNGFSRGFELQRERRRTTQHLVVPIGRENLERLVAAKERVELFQELIRDAAH